MFYTALHCYIKYILTLRANFCNPNEWALPSKSKGIFCLKLFKKIQRKLLEVMSTIRLILEDYCLWCIFFSVLIVSATNKGQIISKGLLVSSNSPKKRTNEFVFTTTTNSFIHFLGEFEDTKKSFWNFLKVRWFRKNFWYPRILPKNE